ncbi:MAG: hypothetical protein ABIH00_01235 [Armatimonadota bacterium]
MKSALLNSLIIELQEKLDSYTDQGAIISIYEEGKKTKIHPIIVDKVKIVNVYEKLDGGFELDIGWQPAEFNPEGDGSYTVSSPLYHHIANYEVDEDCLKFYELDPDKKEKRIVKIELLKDEKEDRRWAIWQDFKASHIEIFEKIDEKLNMIPWGRFIDHKGCG